MMNILNKNCNTSANKKPVQALGIFAATVFVCSFPSLADDIKRVETAGKWHMGSPLTPVEEKLGNKEQKDTTSVSVTNVAVDDSRAGWKLNVEFDLSEHFAIGAAYVDLKDVELDVGGVANPEQNLFTPGKKILPTSADGFALESIYHYNLSDNLGLTGSIGLFNWEGDFDTQSLNPVKQMSGEGGTDVFFGLGGGYQLTEDMTLKINWERYKLDNEATEMWSIGVNYHFK